MPSPLDKIKRLVVLMMENRSFDHMFGRMMSSGYPIDGLTGSESNPDSAEQATPVSFDAKLSGDLTPDPGHHFADVNLQIFGNAQGVPDGGPLMKGFVESYHTHTHDVAKSRRIMKCFSPDKIPVLTTLAKQYAICDRWFSSVPGPTLPNRAYIHSATSIGRVDMSPIWKDAAETIYERLDKSGLTAKIYYHDWTMAMTFQRLINAQGKYFGLYDDFERACKLGTLPAYSLIEPRYYDTDSGASVFEASDQHPDHSVAAGERLIRNVYQAIRKNQQVWESTILLITYDEHGGLYDHVTPPATINPDGKNASNPGENQAPGLPPFEFKRLGIRVPAVVVSPYIEQGTIDKTQYDHTSTIATARKLFLGSSWQSTFLTLRDQTANTFEGLLTRSSPRTDAPLTESLSFREAVIPPKLNPRKKLTVHQKALVDQAYEMEQTLPPQRRTGKTPAQIKTERAAARYVQEVASKLTGRDVAAETGR